MYVLKKVFHFASSFELWGSSSSILLHIEQEALDEFEHIPQRSPAQENASANIEILRQHQELLFQQEQQRLYSEITLSLLQKNYGLIEQAKELFQLGAKQCKEVLDSIIFENFAFFDALVLSLAYNYACHGCNIQLVHHLREASKLLLSSLHQMSQHDNCNNKANVEQVAELHELILQFVTMNFTAASNSYIEQMNLYNQIKQLVLDHQPVTSVKLLASENALFVFNNGLANFLTLVLNRVTTHDSNSSSCTVELVTSICDTMLNSKNTGFSEMDKAFAKKIQSRIS